MGQVSRLVHEDGPGSCKGAAPTDPGDPAEDPCQGLFQMPPDTPASEAAPRAAPASESRQPPVCAEPPEEDGRPSECEPDLESSSGSGLASSLGSQVMGEVNNFPWDLQSSQGSGRGRGPSGPGLRGLPSGPFLVPQLAHLQSSAEEQSESEDYSEDQRFYQHILQMAKISRRLEGLGLPGSMQERPCGELAGGACCVAAESSRLSSVGEHEAIRALERDSRLLAWGPEQLEHPQEGALAPAGQEAAPQACFQPSSSLLRQALGELSASERLAVEPGQMQLLHQVGFSAWPPGLGAMATVGRWSWRGSGPSRSACLHVPSLGNDGALLCSGWHLGDGRVSRLSHPITCRTGWEALDFPSASHAGMVMHSEVSRCRYLPGSDCRERASSSDPAPSSGSVPPQNHTELEAQALAEAQALQPVSRFCSWLPRVPRDQAVQALCVPSLPPLLGCATVGLALSFVPLSL